MPAHNKTPLANDPDVTNLVSIYYFENDDIESREMHKLNFWQFHYQIKGEKELVINSMHHHMKPGMLAIIGPNSDRTQRSICGYNDSAVCSFTCDSPQMDIFRDMVIQLKTEEINLFMQIIQFGIQYFVRVDRPGMYGMFLKENTPSSVLKTLKIYIELLLLTLHSRMTSEPNPLLLLNQTCENTQSAFISKIKDYFSANICNSLSVKQIAQEFHSSPTTLQETFKKMTGVSLMQYFSRMKIARAQQLIKEGKLSIAAISDLLSYSSPSYFSRVFKKIMGMSPVEYRKNI